MVIMLELREFTILKIKGRLAFCVLLIYFETSGI